MLYCVFLDLLMVVYFSFSYRRLFVIRGLRTQMLYSSFLDLLDACCSFFARSLFAVIRSIT